MKGCINKKEQCICLDEKFYKLLYYYCNIVFIVAVLDKLMWRNSKTLETMIHIGWEKEATPVFHRDSSIEILVLDLLDDSWNAGLWICCISVIVFRSVIREYCMVLIFVIDGFVLPFLPTVITCILFLAFHFHHQIKVKDFMFTFLACLHPFIVLLKKMLTGLLNWKMVHLLVVGKSELSLPCTVLPLNSVDPRKIKVSMA